METLLAGLAIWGFTVIFGVQARKAQVKAEDEEKLQPAKKPGIPFEAEQAPVDKEPSIFVPVNQVEAEVPEKPITAEQAPSDQPAMLSGKRMSRRR